MNFTAAIVAHVATVHFVGICMFTPLPPAAALAKTNTTASVNSTPSNDFVAIMPYIPSHMIPVNPPNATALSLPNVPAHAMAAPPANAKPANRSTNFVPNPGEGPAEVEPHAAFLIFQDSDLLEVNGWDVKRFASGFLSIQLHGEHLSFVGDGVNSTVSSTVTLPHDGGQLRPEYLPPYPDAAAVFDIPSGQLTACARPPVSTTSRIDTELTLANRGKFTIRAGTKSLTVDGDAVVVAANTPAAFANNGEAHPSDTPHFTVYCSMTIGGTCGGGVSKADEDIHPLGACQEKTLVMIGGRKSSRAALPDSVAMMDFACSNSQWP